MNLTKVSSLDEIEGSLDYVITKYFSPLKFHLIKYKIDNISASLSLNRFISLHYLAVHSKNIRFNPVMRETNSKELTFAAYPIGEKTRIHTLPKLVEQSRPQRPLPSELAVQFPVDGKA